MAELLIGLIIGFLLGAYTFNRQVREGVSKFLTKGKEKPKPKTKSKGGKV